MGLMDAVQRRLHPLQGIVSIADYHAAKRYKPFQEGCIDVVGESTSYSDKTGLLHSLKEIFRDEVYKFKAKSDRPRIIDAGANIGLSVRYFKYHYPNADVVAYEPDPEIFELLKKNVGSMPGVDLRNAAAWTENTTLTFYSEGSLAGSTEIDFLGQQRSVTVPAQRLKDELSLKPVDFLKIDIEGAENSVLFDIEDQLENVDQLFFEYHSTPGKPQHLGDLLNLVTKAGYRYTINGAHGSPHPFVEPVSHGFDLQLNVSCYRGVPEQ